MFQTMNQMILIAYHTNHEPYEILNLQKRHISIQVAILGNTFILIELMLKSSINYYQRIMILREQMWFIRISQYTHTPCIYRTNTKRLFENY